MPGPNAYSNWIISLLQVNGSTVAGPHNAVLVGGSGGVDGFDDDGEITQDAEAYGGPGLVFRPRPPEDVDTDDGTVEVGAEAVGVRVGDELVPVAWRDLRWNRAFPSPKAGTVALVGYGGGFMSFDDTDTGEGSIQVLYCPYSFSSGVAQKAHAVILDPDEETITLVHGDGASIVLTETEVIIKGPSGGTSMVLSDTDLKIFANVQVMGRMAVGVPTVGAAVPLPVLTGPPGAPVASIDLTVATP
jgi:hypothetical protein